MVDQNHDAGLPSALREPLSRNVQLLLHSRVPARVAWNDAAGRPRVASLWFRWTGSALELSAFVGSVTIERGQGLTSSYREAAGRYLGDEPARDWCERPRDADQALLTVQPIEASASRMWDATYRREPASAR